MNCVRIILVGNVVCDDVSRLLLDHTRVTLRIEMWRKFCCKHRPGVSYTLSELPDVVKSLLLLHIANMHHHIFILTALDCKFWDQNR